MKNSIVSSVPGRFRIQDAVFADASAAKILVAQLVQEFPGISPRLNGKASSLIVGYDFHTLSRTELESRTLALLSTPATPPRRHVRKRSFRLRANRYAKIGALASLGASLAFAAAGRKRLHIATGYLFLAFLGVHLAVFRRTIVH